MDKKVVALLNEAILSNFIKTNLYFFRSLALSHEWSWLAGFSYKLKIAPIYSRGGLRMVVAVAGGAETEELFRA